jgi:hypothetical protein
MSIEREHTTVKEMIEFLQKCPPDAVVMYGYSADTSLTGRPIAQPEIDYRFSYNDCIEDGGLYLAGEQYVDAESIDDLSEEGRQRIKYVCVV